MGSCITLHWLQSAAIWTVTQPLLTAHCTCACEELLCLQVCRDPPPMHCSTVFGKLHSTPPSTALQSRLTAAWCPAITPMQVCCSYRYAVTHNQCPATLVLAKCTSHRSVMLCKIGSQQPGVAAITPDKDLVFVQVCRDPRPVHCSTDFGKIHSILLSAALQNRLTAAW